MLKVIVHEDVTSRLSALPSQLASATRTALAATARGALGQARRAIQARVNLPTLYIQDNLYIRRSAADWIVGASPQDGVPLVVYPHTALAGGRRGKGYRVQVLASGPAEVWPTAFALSKRPTQWGPALFARESSARYPIALLRGPSVATVFAAVAPALLPELEAIYQREFAAALAQAQAK